MAKRNIMSVGVHVPHIEVENVNIDTKRSLADGEVIFFRPNLYLYPSKDYQGKRCLSDARSFQIKETISHWRQQILAALDAGKTIVVMLSQFQEFFIDSGERSYSGAGRSRVTTRHVELRNNYSMLPITFKSITSAIGERVVREQKITPIEYYWDALGKISNYVIYFESDKVLPLLRTADRAKIVAAHVKGKGHLVLVPNLSLDYDDLYEETTDLEDEPVFSEKGRELGVKILSALVAIDNEARALEEITEPPEWSKSDAYRLSSEAKLEHSLVETSQEIDRLQILHQSQHEALREYVRLRDLLFEKGPRLEEAIRIALKELGYDVNSINDGESEFDVVFSADGHRYIGEAEGRDNRAINVDKFSQLERNIQEDFAKEATTEYASGVLFGNAFRLAEPTDRKEWFTTKVMSAAKRSGIRLVRTIDLFRAVQHLRMTADSEFAASCRLALRDQTGTVVIFPSSSDLQECVATTERL